MNDYRADDAKNNVEANWTTGVFRARRALNKGVELFLSYGPDYWETQDRVHRARLPPGSLMYQ